MTNKTHINGAQDCEKLVVAGIIQDDNKFLQQALDAGITLDHISNHGYALMLKACLKLNDEGKTVDFVVLTEELEKSGELDNAGGRAHIADVGTTWLQESSYATYLTTIQESYERRRILAYAQELQNKAMTERDHNALLNAVNMTPADFSSSLTEANKPRTASEVFKSTYKLIEERMAAPNKATLPTPWLGMNNALGGGLAIGELHFFAGRPSSGKSLVAGELSIHWGELGIGVCNHSFETSEEGYMFRHIANKSGIAQNALKNGRLNKGDIQSLKKTKDVIKGASVRFKRYSNANRLEVAKTIRALCKEGVNVHIIDYLQKCDPACNEELRSDKARIDAFLREIDQVRRSTGCTIVMLAQTDRRMDECHIGKLNLSMISDTSTAEKDADTIWFITKGWTNEDNEGEESQRALICLKGRDTGVGQKVKLKMDGAYARLTYIHPHEQI